MLSKMWVIESSAPRLLETNSASLRNVRNHFGPSWLLDLKKATLDAAERRLANRTPSVKAALR
ncbi:hypothetical protein [Sphingomonas panacis]|uniref:hypothetical protein n=1 Tax=Sphingomonas panacis TaxID=1560345 RepID=UPI000AE87A46|nr:hypothetical protein [Sphingomonas panacis]